MERRSLFIPEGLVGERVDTGLARLLGFSRAFAAELTQNGGVTIDGRAVTKSERLRAGSVIEVSWQPVQPIETLPTFVADFQIIHDDDDIVVVNKPPWVAAHPSLGWTGPTVTGALMATGYRISTSGPPERQGVVHRLDVGTSGTMVVAKSERAYSDLKRKFHDREVTKTYHALAQGYPDPFRGTINAPIARHPGSDWKFAVVSAGRNAITHYETVEALNGASLLRVRLETGRTHQIRVHLSAHRHPCVGDILYGADPTLSHRLGLSRQWLHASELSFTHPGSGELVFFNSPFPEDLSGALKLLTG